MQKPTDIMKCFNYSSIYFNIAYSLITIGLIYWAIRDTRVGLAVSVALIFVLGFVPYTIGYVPLTMVKLTLIVFGSGLLFLALNYDCFKTTANQLLTMIMRVNIGGLIVSTHNVFLAIALLFVVATTPIITVYNKTVKLESVLIPKDAWVVLSTAVLIMYYISSQWFCHNLGLVAMAALIPCCMHFIGDKFIESRTLALCVLIVFDIFNNSKKSINNLLDDSTY